MALSLCVFLWCFRFSEDLPNLSRLARAESSKLSNTDSFLNVVYTNTVLSRCYSFFRSFYLVSMLSLSPLWLFVGTIVGSCSKSCDTEIVDLPRLTATYRNDIRCLSQMPSEETDIIGRSFLRVLFLSGHKHTASETA